MESTMPPRGEVAAGETRNLISADKVTGTAVYNGKGERVGSIHGVMINKLNGHVSYAIMSFGGFLGLGERYHPLPWRVLTYDMRRDGYVVDLDRDLLRNAPSYTTEADWLRECDRIDAYYTKLPAD